MYYAGIDIGKRTHVACVLDQEGKKVVKPFKFANSKEGYEKLFQKISSFEEVLISLEATGHYWIPLFEALTNQKFHVTALNPLQVSAFRNQGIRGSKTDDIDCVLIAQVSRFGVQLETKLPDDTVLALRQLCRWRADLVQQITNTRLKLQSVLDQVFPEFSEVFKSTTLPTARKVLAEMATPDEVLEVDYKKLLNLIEKASRGVFGEEKAKELVSAAKNSVGIKTSRKIFGFQIKLIVEQINHLKEQTKKIDQEVKKLYSKLDNKLISIPGINIKTAAAIIGETGTDFSRFKNEKGGATAFVAFSGFDPRAVQSGTSDGPRKMSKRGSPYLRKAIWHSAFIAKTIDPMFKQLYEKQKSRGKHHFVAMGHLANKMCHVIYSVMKNNKEYYPVLNQKEV